MKFRRFRFAFLLTCPYNLHWLDLGLAANPAVAAGPTGGEGSTPTIKTETRLVLVDTVVTDKKGNYIRDLTQKDFRVWEDNKEQTVKTFSAETDAYAPSGEQRHYLILFFDNSTMNMSDQAQARAAA